MLNNFNRRLETLEGFETDYVRLLYYDLPKNFSSLYRTYNYTRFCTIVSGEKHVKLDNENEFTYGEDNYLLLPANTTVQMDMDVHTRALVFELNDDLIKDVISKVEIDQEIDEEILQNIKVDNNYCLGVNKWDIHKDALNILEISKQNERNKEFLIDLYAQKLVFNLIQDKSTHYILGADCNNPINIALKYINENIDRAINIGGLAETLFMSESNFSHLFKKTIGVTPGEYIKNKKLQRASVYLKEINVTDVAYNLGYRNLSYFIKIFKDRYGLTPKQYKLAYYG